MRNLYKNSMVDFIKQNDNKATCAKLFEIYKNIAISNNPNYNTNFIWLNIHTFAKRHGKYNGKILTKNHRISHQYIFNF